MKRILFFSFSVWFTFSTFTMYRPCIRPAAPKAHRHTFVLPQISRRFTNVSPNPCHLERFFQHAKDGDFPLAQNALAQAIQKGSSLVEIIKEIEDKERRLKHKLQFFEATKIQALCELAAIKAKPGELPMLSREVLSKK